MQGVTVPFADPMTQSLVDKCSTWHVPYSLLETELRRQNVRVCSVYSAEPSPPRSI